MKLIQKMNIYEVKTHIGNEDSYGDWGQTQEVTESIDKLQEIGIYIKNKNIHER